MPMMQCGHRPDSASGGFYASPPKKLTGALTETTHIDHLVDHDLQEAGWAAIVALSEGADVEGVGDLGHQ